MEAKAQAEARDYSFERSLIQKKEGNVGVINKCLDRVVNFFSVAIVFGTQLQTCLYADCGYPDRVWVDAEYLYWAIQDSPEPVPLVFEGDSETAVLSDPHSFVVLGGKHVNLDWRSGGRFELGAWFDEDCCLGLAADYFFLPSGWKKKSVFSSGLEGSPFLLVPYFNAADDGAEASFPIASSVGDPAEYLEPFSGRATLKIKNRMQGAELNALSFYPCCCELNVTWLAGFRYWNFNETLSFVVNSPFVGEPDNVFITTDRFTAENNFYGGQIGVLLDYAYDCFFANVKGKVALGADCGTIEIYGNLETNEYLPGIHNYKGGLFALPSNIGKHSKTVFSVIPEINVNLGFEVSDNARIQVGYTFFYVSNMFWAGKQIDPNLNLSQAPADGYPTTPAVPPAPVSLQKASNLWVQGVSAGFEFRF